MYFFQFFFYYKCTRIVQGWALSPIGLGPKPYDTLYDPVPILDLWPRSGHIRAQSGAKN